MKKLFFLSIFLLLLASCSNDESETVFLSKSNTWNNKARWYGMQLPKEQPATRGVADGTKRWNQNSGIYVKFINQPSDSAMIDKIKQIVSEWEEYAAIRFNFVDSDKKTDVRIAFDWNDNDWLTWSYTGTDAKFVRNQKEPTAVFGGLKYLSEEEFKGDVLRVFGQILGLEYEQRHQEWSQKGYWKSESQLESYWIDQFDGYGMDWQEIREYVFVPLTQWNATDLYQSKEIDELSVMAWPYYNRRQSNKLVANYCLSEGDKAFIAKLYPKASLPTIQKAWVDAGYFRWTDNSKTALRITDFGIEQEYLPDVCDGEQLTSAYEMFNRSRIKRVPKFNTSNITNFGHIFSGCRSLTSIPQLDTSNGISFAGMLSGCVSLTSISQLNTSNGINFDSIFYSCVSLTSIPQLDISNGTNFESMFFYCSSLTSIPQLDTSNGTNFGSMFDGCKSLITIPLLDTSNGTNFDSMFSGCKSLTSIPQLDTSSGTNFAGMLSGCTLTVIPIFDTSKGTSFAGMFYYCYYLTEVPKFDTSSGTNFRAMFFNCSSLHSIPKFDTSQGTNFANMFAYCSRLYSVPELDTSQGVDFYGTFYGCFSLMTKPNLNISNATNTKDMFYGTPFQND